MLEMSNDGKGEKWFIGKRPSKVTVHLHNFVKTAAIFGRFGDVVTKHLSCQGFVQVVVFNSDLENKNTKTKT